MAVSLKIPKFAVMFNDSFIYIQMKTLRLLFVAFVLMTAMPISAQRIQVVDKEGNGIPLAYVLTEDGNYIGSTDMDGVLADVKGAERVAVTHVAYRPKLVTVSSLQGGRVSLDDLDYGIAEVVITPKPYVYVEIYYRVYVYRNDSLGYFHCGVMPNAYDIKKKKFEHGSFHSNYVEYYSKLGVAITWSARAMSNRAGEVRMTSAPNKDKMKKQYYVTTDDSNPDHWVFRNPEGRVGQLVRNGDQLRTTLDAGKIQMYANKVKGESSKLKKREDIGYNYQFTLIGNYKDDVKDADFTDFIMEIDHWEYTDKKGPAKYIIESYATERGYITKDEWKEKNKELKAQFKHATTLQDMEAYERQYNIPALPSAVRQALSKLKHL